MYNSSEVTYEQAETSRVDQGPSVDDKKIPGSDDIADNETESGEKGRSHDEVRGSIRQSFGEGLSLERTNRSTSRDSSMNDDPRSLMDSVSASSSRQMCISKETGDDDASISPIRGDSISATIADFHRKHSSNQESTDRPSCTLNESERANRSQKADDTTSKLNFYPAGGSNHQDSNSQLSGNNKQVDFTSVSSTANIDAFDIIEESGSLSSDEAILRQATNNKSASNERVQDPSLTDEVVDQRLPQSQSRSRLRDRRHARPNTRRRARPSNALEQAFENIYDMPPDASTYQIEPIMLRGNGNLTLFGLSNSFSDEFPSALIGRVSREEFDKTMRRINSLLRDQQSLSAKLLLFGGLCCCCSLGFSLFWPSIALKKRSKMSLEKFIASENNRLYSKLGLNWKLAEQRCYSNPAFVEYVLMIEFTPKIMIYQPD